jgi:hypothetical protein
VPLAHELANLVANFQIRSRHSFDLFARSFRTPGASAKSDFALSDDARALLSQLLYSTLHCRAPQEPQSTRHALDPLAARDFTQRLSDTNSGKGCWQAGWRVMGSDRQRIELAKHGIRWFVHPQQVRPGSTVEIGNTVYVRIGKEQRELFPGYYMAFGSADDPENQLIRFYWNISVKGAPSLTSRVTERFNQATIPFRLKVLRMPALYPRSDAAVLYVPRDRYDDAHALVSELQPSLRQFLSPAVSAFVKPIGFGVGLADDPGPGKSFGQVATAILADALCAQPAQKGATRRRISAVIAALSAQGIDPERPYLCRGSSDVYRTLDG